MITQEVQEQAAMMLKAIREEARDIGFEVTSAAKKIGAAADAIRRAADRYQPGSP